MTSITSPNNISTTAHLVPVINRTVNTTPVPQKGGYANSRAPINTAELGIEPNSPESASCSSMTSDGKVTVSWSPVTNDTSILGYGITLISPNGEELEYSAYKHVSSLTIKGLNPAITYRCEVSSVNEEGWSLEPRVTNPVSI